MNEWVSGIFSVHSLQSGINKQAAQTYYIQYMKSISHNRNEWTSTTNQPLKERKKNCYALILQRLCSVSTKFVVSRAIFSLSLYPFCKSYFNVIRKLRVNYYEILCFCEKKSNSLLCVKTTKINILFKLLFFFLVYQPSN